MYSYTVYRGDQLESFKRLIDDSLETFKSFNAILTEIFNSTMIEHRTRKWLFGSRVETISLKEYQKIIKKDDPYNINLYHSEAFIMYQFGVITPKVFVMFNDAYKNIAKLKEFRGNLLPNMDEVHVELGHHKNIFDIMEQVNRLSSLEVQPIS